MRADTAVATVLKASVANLCIFFAVLGFCSFFFFLPLWRITNRRFIVLRTLEFFTSMQVHDDFVTNDRKSTMLVLPGERSRQSPPWDEPPHTDCDFPPAKRPSTRDAPCVPISISHETIRARSKARMKPPWSMNPPKSQFHAAVPRRRKFRKRRERMKKSTYTHNGYPGRS
jgi:hypothetical protein